MDTTTSPSDVEAQTSSDQKDGKDVVVPPASLDQKNISSSSTATTTTIPTTTAPSSTISLEAVADLKMKAMGWARPPVEHFEEMNLHTFEHYSHLHAEVVRDSVLGPTSMKHPSWKGSDAPVGPCLPLTAILISMTLALVVGLAVGLTVDDGVAWGVGSALIAMTVSILTLLIILVVYMSCYGNGLHEPPMPRGIERAGFLCNHRANVLCRCIMTCCYNDHRNIVRPIMNGEADDTLERIQKMNNGQGPPPGGVCWIGDSEFTFWHRLSRDMQTFHSNHINAGFGGSRITDIQENIHRLCLDWDPSIVIVHASGNDYDYDLDITAGEIPAKLIQLFETIAAHPSVTRIGYMLSSRRPIYSDAKWDFMVRVHTLTIQAIAESPALKDIVKVLDMRSNLWPLDHFVDVDRVHLNDLGHSNKSKALLPKLLAIWPLEEE